jgi:glycosyltransferase involved in cell wall biosynthesis
MTAFAPVYDEAPLALPQRQRLRVAVLVDLALTAEAGGHVKCWERLAQAALRFDDRLDLTLFFIGAERELRIIGDNVRYVIEPPAFSTQRFPFLSHVPDHTDLAFRHRRLARMLRSYDVIHTTDAFFAYARTALEVAREWRIPMVNSVHTNTPGYARIFTTQTVERVFGRGFLGSLLLERLGVARYAERRMLRQLAEHQRACAAVLVSRPDQLDATSGEACGSATLLRRGIDRSFFHPDRRDRAWLGNRFGIADDRFVVLFAGRVNRGKNVLVLADAMTELVARGLPVHLFCAGEGEHRAAIAERLGGHATLPGSLDPDTLARVYASADLFGSPSPVEECANVVLEALASGLPVMVATESGMGRIVSDGETGFVLPSDQPHAWAQAMARLAGDRLQCAALARGARRYAERKLPSWADVLAEDLLPQWRRAAVPVRR